MIHILINPANHFLISGQPSDFKEECALWINAYHGLADASCKEQQSFICQPKKRKFSIRFKLEDSSLFAASVVESGTLSKAVKVTKTSKTIF